MADKSFGVKELNLISASGTPTITSPNSVNINATNVAISTDITVGGMVSLGAGTSISSPGTNVLTFGTNSTEKVRINSDGRVEIGGAGSAIDSRLHVTEPTASGRTNVLTLETRGTSTDDGPAINFISDSGSTVGGSIVGAKSENSGSNAYLAFHTYNSSLSEKLRIAANGDIGIANASPTSWGAGIPTIEIKGTVSSGGNSTRSGAIAFESGSGSNGYAVLWGQNGGIHIYTSATNRASATYAAQFNSSGNLAFASGNGIDFSATGDGSGTMSSELLDDYEEGTWNPNGSYTFTHATYTKIGRQVFCQFSCASSPSGLGTISLPFTPSNNVTGSGSSEQVRYVGDVQFFVSGGNDDSTYKYIWQGNIGASMYLHKLSGSGAQSWTATFGSNVSNVTVFISFIVA